MEDTLPPCAKPRRVRCAWCEASIRVVGRGCYCSPACKMKATRTLQRATGPDPRPLDLARAALIWTIRRKPDLAAGYLALLVTWHESGVTRR